MKPKFRSSRSSVGSDAASSVAFVASLAFAAAVISSPFALADDVWTNTSTDGDWNNDANWSGTHGDNALISTGTTSNFPTVSTTPSWNVNDLLVGAANAGSGRVDVTGGTLSANFWTKIGDWNDTGILNLADTSGIGGTYTNLAQGGGSYVSGALDGNGNILVGLYNSTGTLNMNTTGSLTGSGLYIAPNNQAGSGTFNLDSGTVNISGDMQVGSDFWGAGTSSAGNFNMSGGLVNVGGFFEIGHLGLSATSGTSQATISGGTLNSENDLKLGFAGGAGTTSSMTITGSGVVNAGSSTVRWVVLGQYDPTDVNMTVSNGGTLNLNAGTDMMFGISGNSGDRLLDVDGGTVQGTATGGSYINMQQGTSSGTSTINIKNGGLVAVDAILGGAVSTLNFDDGTLQATADDGFFIGDGFAVNINAGGATLDTNGHNVTDRANMAGTGDLAKTGSGTLTLSGASTYTGATTVSAGTLLVTGSLGATDVTVESGATIGGPGSLAGNLFLDAGSGFLFSETDTLSVTGTVSLDSSFGVDDLVGLSASTADGTYTLIDGTSTDFSVLGIQNWGEANKYTLGANKFAWFESGSLDLVVVPEPGAALIGSLGMICLLRRRRRA